MAGGRVFPRTARILSPADFARVYGRRCSAAAGPLVLYAAPQDHVASAARVGLSVSRRIGNAVVRNRWKRRLREAFRTVRTSLPSGTDFVIVVRSGEPGRGAEAARLLEQSIESLAARVTERPGYAAARSQGRGATRPPRGR